MNSPLKEVDVVIIGGGMVGASLALLLPEHLKVTVLESFPLPPADAQGPVYQPSYDARSTALAFNTIEVFKKAGVWPLIEKHAEPIRDVHVSDKGYWGSTLMSESEEALSCLGYVVENAWLGRSLLHHVQQRENVTFICPATVKKLSPMGDAARVFLEKEGEEVVIEATLAIVADGAQSKICQTLGIHTHVEDYGHTAIVANISTSQAHEGVAYERFTDTGPLALLPLSSGEDGLSRSALIWTLPTKQAEALLAASDDDFLHKIQERFGFRLGELVRVGERVSYPLKLTMSEEQVRQNIVVLGNAAHSLHPVAGQGFNLALRDVVSLCELLGQLSREELGNLKYLKGYELAQKQDQKLTMLFSDVLPQLFSSKSVVLAAGRGLGLVGLDLLPTAKSAFVKFAAGVRAGN